MVTHRAAGAKASAVDGRPDDHGIAVVIAQDPAAHVLRVGDEGVDPAGRSRVPAAHRLKRRARGQAPEWIQTAVFQVHVIEVPGVAHGCVTVANMELAYRLR